MSTLRLLALCSAILLGVCAQAPEGPTPISPSAVTDWCAMHGIDKNADGGEYCSTAATLNDITRWCAGAANAINPTMTDLRNAVQQLCVQLITGQRVVTTESIAESAANCGNDPAACANATTLFETASNRAVDFPDATFLRALSTDERRVALAHGTPCHVENYDAANYHKVTWWYCDSDANYIQAYTFLNGRFVSSYTP